MRRFTYAALVFALAWAVVTPAVGRHIQGPTDPITDVSFTLSEYSTGTPIECGSVVIV